MGRQTDKAMSVLKGAMARVRREDGSRLPSLVVMSRQAGVSHVTMQACVRELVARGELETCRGSGIYLAGSRLRPKPVVAQRWRQVADRVQNEIQAGRYARGSRLPTSKELAQRYGVCPATLRKSLVWLAERRLVEPDHRRYRVPRAPGVGSRSTVVAVTIGTPQQSVSRPTQRHADDLREFENVCTRAGLSVQLEYCWFEGEEQVLVSPGGLSFTQAELDRIMGFAIFTRGLELSTIEQATASLAPTGRPIAALDDTDVMVRNADRFSSPGTHIFSMANSSLAGEEMGRVVQGLGHQNAAYIGLAGTEWSRARLEGIRRILSAAYVSDHEIPPLPGLHPEGDPEQWFARHAVRSFGTSPHERLVVRALEGNAGRAAQFLMDAGVRHEAYLDAIPPVVDRVMDTSPPTFIVCGNDDIAGACVEVLRSRGLRVPEDVSVAGFDDTLESFLNGMTSYNFDSAGAAQAMLNHILAPPIGPRRVRQGGIGEVRGFVSLRSTTKQV